jgi:hypothetical protein
LRRFVLILVIAALAPLSALSQVPTASSDGPVVPALMPLPLKFVARLPPGPNRECSGIVRSRKTADLFWTHNDSGDEPRIYPIHRDGSAYRSATDPDISGVLIEGATHIDWEDIATFDDGTLVIADMGNNGNRREDLSLYFVAEPSPTASRAPFSRKLHVRFPDQTTFPAPKNNFNFDCEAVFTFDKTVYVLTKHRSDPRTKLYRLDEPQDDQVNTLTLLGDFEIGGSVVGADCTSDGKRLTVMTYKALWLFERDDLATPFFKSRTCSRPFILPQAEGVCFADETTLLLTDEIVDSVLEVQLSDVAEGKR